jgi:hypothetical protein
MVLDYCLKKIEIQPSGQSKMIKLITIETNNFFRNKTSHPKHESLNNK